MLEVNVLRAGITKKLLYLCGNLTTLAIQGLCCKALGKVNFYVYLSAGGLATHSFNIHKLFRQPILKFYLDLMLFLF